MRTNDPADYLPALVDWSEETFDEHWTLIDELLANVPKRDVIFAAQGWCTSPDTAIRAVGLDVLGKVCELHPDITALLLGEISSKVRSLDTDVRWSAAVALRRIPNEQAERMLLDLLEDPSSDVRYQAVCGLPLLGQEDLPEIHPVVQGLMKALRDDHEEVREWAAFGLGQLLTTDTPAVREALRSHLGDLPNVATEAAIGLARRGER